MSAKPTFHTSLQVEHIGGDQWRLTQMPAFYSAKVDRILFAQPSFVIEFASVPRVQGAYLLFAGVGESAAVVYDTLYCSGEMSRRQADAIFLEAPEPRGVSA